MVTDRIISFLRNRGWEIVKENNQSVHLSPPDNFDLPEDYSLIIPKTPKQVDFNRYYNSLLKILSDFYGLSEQDLNALLSEADAILRIRIYDDETADGKISFMRFESFIERLKAVITDTASFVIGENLSSGRNPREAQRYLNKCHFLQTEVGSYITKIQLPAEETIKEADIFSPPINAEDINRRLLHVLDYVNAEIFQNNYGEITDEYIVENENRLNIRLLKAIESFYEKSDIKNINFSLHSVEHSKEVLSENVTKEQINRLSTFIDEVENMSIETNLVTVRGKIETLKSRDPDGGKNKITMQGLANDMPIIASAYLNSDTYKMAIEAHRLKEYVTVTGMAKISRTRVKFIEVTGFTIG